MGDDPCGGPWVRGRGVVHLLELLRNGPLERVQLRLLCLQDTPNSPAVNSPRSLANSPRSLANSPRSLGVSPPSLIPTLPPTSQLAVVGHQCIESEPVPSPPAYRVEARTITS
eukprot:1167994-Prorocentrum_minimum.AAC.1